MSINFSRDQALAKQRAQLLAFEANEQLNREILHSPPAEPPAAPIPDVLLSEIDEDPQYLYCQWCGQLWIAACGIPYRCDYCNRVSSWDSTPPDPDAASHGHQESLF